MRQVLFYIPGTEIPIFFWGVMLFIAFMVGVWLACRRAKAEGVSPQRIQDVAMWVFIGGVVGARGLSMYMDPVPGQSWTDFIRIWNGGMILYGGVGGAILAGLLVYFLILRRDKISLLQVTDIIAPSVALGLFFGRIGCFMTGCCYGDFVDASHVPWSVQFPANSPVQRQAVLRGYQTNYGFILAEERRPPQQRAHDARIVQRVETGSRADQAGLRSGDLIVNAPDLDNALARPADREPIKLTVQRPVPIDPIAVASMVAAPASFLAAPGVGLANYAETPPQAYAGVLQTNVQTLEFEPSPSLPVHPTQLYSALDGLIIFFLLIAYYPFRRQRGEVMALFMICYGITRFLIEILRGDNPLFTFVDIFSLTMSQYVSVALVVGGIGFWAWLRVRAKPQAAAN